MQADDPLYFEDSNTLFWLTLAICEHENGPAQAGVNVSDDDIDAGVAAALRKDEA